MELSGIKERTNLYRVLAQTLEWVYGLTNIEFGVKEAFVTRVEQGGDLSHYAFEVVTNTARLTGLTHPLGLVVESVHLSLTGVLEEVPKDVTFDGDNRSSEIDLERAFKMYLKADNGGYCPVAVNVKITRFDGGEDALARHFLYRSNLLHKIR